MSFVLTKGIDDEDATEFAYVACAYACIANENQALVIWIATTSNFFKSQEKLLKV